MRDRDKREKRDKICGKERILNRDRERNGKREQTEREKIQRKKESTCSAWPARQVKPCSIFPLADRPADSTHIKLLNKKTKKLKKQKQNNLRQLSCCCVQKHQNLKLR